MKGEEMLDALGDAAFEAYVASGSDTDGATNWREFFPAIKAPSWEEVVGTAVREAISSAENDAEVAESKLRRIEARMEGAIYLPGSTLFAIKAILEEQP